MNQTLFLMLGYPGAGKTTTAKIIHELSGAEHLWADHERRERFGEPTYAHEETLKLYGELNKVVEKLLQGGKSVIFDTNFNFYKDRKHLRSIAANNGAKSILVWVRAPKEIAKQRAVVDAHKHHHTRILGHMPESHFERIAEGLEPPHNDEPYIELDGTKIDTDYVRSKLTEAGVAL